MDWWTAIVLGIVQGVTEWLPISSSGQSSLILINGFGLDPRIAISLGLAIHLGTALAVVVKYPKDMMRMLDVASGNIPEFYWTATIISIISSIPFLIILEETFESNMWTGETITMFIGLALILTGVIIREQYRRPPKKLSAAKFKDYVVLGIAQGFAVLPGISRSGTTMATLLIRDFDKASSLKFSFLLSVPVSIAAAVYFVMTGNALDIGLGPYIVSGIFAFIFGYFTMDLLMKLAKQVDFSKFCILFGLISVAIPFVFWLI